MRKTLLTIIVLASLALVAAILGQRLFTQSAGNHSPAAPGEFSPLAAREMKARGIVVPARWTQLRFPVGGQLAGLLVESGDAVSSGQVLARLDTTGLELQLKLAQSELELQEANLSQLQEGASEAELSAAQANYEAAVAAHEDLLAGPSPEETAIAQADLARAEISLQRAQAAYDAVSSLPNIGARPESVQLESATIDYQRAQAAYELATAGPDEAALKEADSQVASAKAQLETLQESPPLSEVRSAQASVSSAETNLARAQLKLEQATLRAPFDGTITSITDTQPPDIISEDTTALTLADLSTLQVETTDLDEWVAGNIAVGQTVDLLIPGLANRNLRGHIASIAEEPTIDPSGAVFYKTVIALGEEEPELRWGMTVQIQFGAVSK
jgi:HlyD family secretion protein